MTSTEQQRRQLHMEGFSDGEIAKRVGVTRATICGWRKSRGLGTNMPEAVPAKNPTAFRRLLHDMGWGAKSIAREEGVSVKTVRDWRKRHNISPNEIRGCVTKQRGADQLRHLQHRVISAVGHKLPFDIAADAAAALMLAVIEGEVPLNQIESQGRLYGNRALGEYANSFKQQSLDEDIPGTDGLRAVDLLVDDSTSSWLEEMGATCH